MAPNPASRRALHKRRSLISTYSAELRMNCFPGRYRCLSIAANWNISSTIRRLFVELSLAPRGQQSQPLEKRLAMSLGSF